MTLRLNGSTSGYVEIDAPATAGSNTLVLPTGNGTNGQYLQTNGSGSLSWASVSGMPAQPLTLGTAVASTSGTAIDFTGIPSTVKRITVTFNGVSTSGGSAYLIQIGSGSIETTGYTGASSRVLISAETANYTTGFGIYNGSVSAAYVSHGSMSIFLLDPSSYIWAESGVFGGSDSASTTVTGGSKTLSGTLDRVRITTVNGSQTFDAGKINIMYEG